MSRYGNNIRRLAKTEELKDLVRQAEQRIKVLEKSSIPGQRGIAYPTSTAIGTPGQTNPDNNGEPFDPSLFENNKNEAGIDDDVVDGDDLLTGGAKPEVGEDIGSIELEDCDTGERIDVRFNTGGNDGEAVFKHPAEWDIDGPRTDPSYLEGSVWTLSSGGTSYFSNSFKGLLEEFKTAGGWAYVYTIDAGVVFRLVPIAGDVLIQFTNNEKAIGQVPVGGVQYQYTTSTTSVPAGKYGRLPCGTLVGDTTACAAAAPDEYENWQEQDVDVAHQLAFSAAKGGFVSSRFDTTIPLKYKNPASTDAALDAYETQRGLSKLQLCTPTGNPVVVEVLKDGSFAYFEDDGFGNPDVTTNDILHFDKDGRYISTMTEAEQRYMSLA